MATRRDFRRKGGLTTRARYSTEQRRAWGRMGGRPRERLTHDEIRQRQLLERNNNRQEVKGPPAGLSELKRLNKLRHRSNGIPEIQEAGTGQETPRGESLPERTAV